PAERGRAPARERDGRRRAGAVPAARGGPAQRAGARGRPVQGPAGVRRVSSTELADLAVAAAADLLRRREVSSVDLTRAALDRIERRDGQINAYLHVAADAALAAAGAADDRLARE